MADAPPGTLGAVIFDMDGVLIDSEPVWRRVEMDVFASLGIELSDADCRETMGVRIDEAVRLWYLRTPWKGPTPEAVTRRIVTEVIARVRAEGTAMEGVETAVAIVREAGLKCAVASSSPPELIEAVLDRLGIAGAVDLFRSAQDEPRGKPAPDVYLGTAAALGMMPRECLAIEDSVNGMVSASSAGMPCVVIPDRQTGTDPRLATAALRLLSLAEFDAACLERLRLAYFA